MVHKYIVDLTADEQECLFNLIKKGKPTARKVARAHVLLHAVEGATDEEIAQSLHLGVSTVHRARQRFVEEGLTAALSERPRPGKTPALTGKQEAFIVALACSTPPEGRCRWTMQVLAERLVELKQIEEISHDTVRRVLKKTISISEKRGSLPARSGQPECYDYEYKREGTANLFLFVQPLLGWRPVNVTARRTKQDFAQQMKRLTDVYFPQAKRIRLVVDNLNTHTPAALYEAFAPTEARRITRKLEFHYTPKQGSWLNRTECEFAVLATQCLDRRISEANTLSREIAAWQTKRNQQQTKINWQFGTDLARVKLKRLYPSLA